MLTYICPVCNQKWKTDENGALIGVTEQGVWAPIGDTVGCPWCDGTINEKNTYGYLLHWKWKRGLVATR